MGPVIRLAVLAAFLGLAATQALAADLSGPVYVHDGDTWSFHPAGSKAVEIRPSGIDAPELGQKCEKDGKAWWPGWEAGAWLAAYLDGKTVVCTPTGAKTYGRLVADCAVDGEDLQATIVRAGWAMDYTHYSHGRYATIEAEARDAKRGIWQGQCEKPWEWRQEHFR